jgi:hypothetical protein
MLCAVILLGVSVLAGAASAAYHYQFDDIAGTSGRGAQWVVVTASDDTRGAPLGGAYGQEIKTIAELVTSRDYLYLEGGSGGAATDAAVNFIFIVHPDTTVDPTIEFGLTSSSSPVLLATQDITIGDSAYQANKVLLPGTTGASKRFQFQMRKTQNTSEPGTERTHLRFHQNPDYIPSQTLLIPLILASVSSGDASVTPHTFRMTLRDNSGSVVAYDRFTWGVTDDITFGGLNDWIFVPLPNDDLNSNTLYYELTTDITNYSGIRYALDRYDHLSRREPLSPAKWAVDLPASVKDISPDVKLNALSHIPPGFITTYVQSYDVVKARKDIFSMYSVDPAGSPFDMTLLHPPVFGAALGSSSGTDFSISAFRLLQTDPDFIKTATNTLRGGEFTMPPVGSSLSSIATSGFATADAVGTAKVNTPIPGGLLRSEDVTGVLPLHVTFNLQAGHRYIAPLWEDFVSASRNTNNVRDLFVLNYGLYSQDASNRRISIIDWLRGRGLAERVLKVFVDEKNQRLVVSFIVMLHDTASPGLNVVHDKSENSANSFDYLTLGDGAANDVWDTTFYIAPLSDNFSNGSGSDANESGGSASGGTGGGGGGCGAGTPIASLLLGAALLLGRKSMGK